MGGNNSPTTEELLSGGNRSGTGRYVCIYEYLNQYCNTVYSPCPSWRNIFDISIIFSGGTPEQDWYDPSEPRYCICNQVSYGDMVACDNEDVRKFIFSSIIRIKFLVYKNWTSI